MKQIEIINQTDSTITVSRTDWEALLDQMEDRQDKSAILYSEDKLPQRVVYTAEETRRMVMEEVTPVAILRKRRFLSLTLLARMVEMSPSYLSEIEKGRKNGSVAALEKLAIFFKVRVDDLRLN